MALNANRLRGQVNAMTGKSANYGCHYGMRSTLQHDKAEYHEGYNEVEHAMRTAGYSEPQIKHVNIDNVVEWMAQHGRTCYVTMIHDVKCTMSEIEAEGGINGKFCPFVQEQLNKCRSEIEEIKQRAMDRYEDWASD